MSRHYASMGLDVGMRACVLPTGKSPPLTPLKGKETPQENRIPPLSPSRKETSKRLTQNQRENGKKRDFCV